MKNSKYITIIVVVVICLGFLTVSRFTQANESLIPNAVVEGNLLVNGDMDQLGFYWRPQNHYVADTWYQWWGDYNAIPEYLNGGHPYHNQCYPRLPLELCHNDDTHTYNSSQGYILWGPAYIAGIYKPVDNVFPCTLYTFEIWNRNDADSSIYHPKLGIDPTGWIITRLGNSPPHNCPPDGASVCPDPYIGGDYDFPDSMVWSSNLTQAGLVWGKGSLTVEALNTTISVWTYVAPDADQVSKSTYWDYGSLVQTPFPGNKLPEPESWTSTGAIYGVTTSYFGSDVIISWNTVWPASSQVWYNVTPGAGNTTPIDVTDTVFIPAVQKMVEPGMYSNITPIKAAPTTNHTAQISGLNDGDILTFVPLSRFPENSVCKTVSDEQYRITVNIP